MERCPFCQHEFDRLLSESELGGELGEHRVKRIEVEFPAWVPKDGLCERCLADIHETGAIAGRRL